MVASAASRASRHGWRWWGAGLAVLLAAVMASGCGLSDPYETDTQAAATQAVKRATGSGRTGRRSAQPDPEDANAALRARRRRELGESPALQHLPYHQGDVSIDFGNAAPDGRLQLLVTYTGTTAAARGAYRGFLRRWGDDGSGYAVSYRRAGSGAEGVEPPPSLPGSPEAVLRAVAVAVGDWSASSVGASYARAIALSVGAARSQLRRAAAHVQAGAARVGTSLRSQATVAAIDVSGAGGSRRAVVVTKQGISGGGLPEGGYEYQVTLAKVELEPSGWAVSSWEPQP